MLPSSLVIQLQNKASTSHTAEITRSFTGKVGQRQDETKTFDTCPSKSDGEMLPTRFGI